MKYQQLGNGEWTKPVRSGYKMRCCDCGLVHKVDFKISRGRVWLRAFRDMRATAACRRKKEAN